MREKIGCDTLSLNQIIWQGERRDESLYINSLHRRIARSDSICSACQPMTYVPTVPTYVGPTLSPTVMALCI